MTTGLAATTAEDVTPDETIRRTVRALRSAYEVDAAVLARHLGISRGSLYNRLNGAAPWLAAEIAGLAQFFDCEINDFYTGNVRVKNTRSSGTMGVHMDPYSPPSSRGGRALRLVKGTGGDYGVVSAGYGSSDEESGEDDDERHDPYRDSANAEGLLVPLSAGGVNSAHTA